MLKVIVCAKQVLDPEAPAELLRVDGDSLTVSAAGTPEVISPYDANALRAAVDLRGEGGEPGAEITLLTVSPRPAKPLLLKALAAGADRVLALRVPEADGRLVDGSRTARLLAGLVAEAGEHDLILTGRQAADTNAGVVGPLLAGLLGLPLVTLAVGVRQVGEATLEIERLTEDGTETVTCNLPAVVTVSSEIGDLASIDFRALTAAKKKPIRVLEPDEIDVADDVASPGLTGLVKPALERNCEMVAADDDRSAGRVLAEKISEPALG